MGRRHRAKTSSRAGRQASQKRMGHSALELTCDVVCTEEAKRARSIAKSWGDSCLKAFDEMVREDALRSKVIGARHRKSKSKIRKKEQKQVKKRTQQATKCCQCPK